MQGARSDIHARLQRQFGKRLKQARKAAGQGQKTLASALRLSRTSISNMERGTQRIALDQVYEAAHALRVDIGALLPPLGDVIAVDVSVPDRESVRASVIASAREIAQGVQAEIEQRHGRRRRSSKRS